MNNSMILFGFMLLVVMSSCGSEIKVSFVDLPELECDSKEYLGLRMDYPEQSIWLEHIKLDINSKTCFSQKIDVSTSLNAIYDTTSTDSTGLLVLGCPVYPMTCFDQSLFDFMDSKEIMYVRNQYDQLEINLVPNSTFNLEGSKFWELK